MENNDIPLEEYTTRELTKEEGEALTADMKAVLEKHDAELGVVSSIQLLKRVKVEPKVAPVESPKEFYGGDTNQGTQETTPA